MIQEVNSQQNLIVPQTQLRQNPYQQLIQRLDVILLKDPFQLTLQQIHFVARSTQRTKEECNEVVKRGTARIFVKLLQNQDEKIIEEVFYVIGNIITFSLQYGEEIATSRWMQDIFMATQRLKSNPNLFRLGLWNLSKLIQTNVDFSLIAPMIRYICELIIRQEMPNDDVLEYCIGAISKHRQKNKEEIIKKIQIILETNLVSKLLELIHYYRQGLVFQALKLLIRISLGSEEQTEYFLSYGVIQKVSFMLGSPSFISRLRTCYLYYNIIADSEKQAIFFLQHQDIIQNLLVMFKCDSVMIGVKIASIFSLIMRYDLGEDTLSQLFEQRKLLIYYAELLLRCEAVEEFDYLETALDHLYSLFKFCSESYTKFIYIHRAVKKFDFWSLLKSFEGVPNDKTKNTAKRFLGEYENIIKRQISLQNDSL